MHLCDYDAIKIVIYFSEHAFSFALIQDFSSPFDITLLSSFCTIFSLILTHYCSLFYAWFVPLTLQYIIPSLLTQDFLFPFNLIFTPLLINYLLSHFAWFALPFLQKIFSPLLINNLLSPFDTRFSLPFQHDFYSSFDKLSSFSFCMICPPFFTKDFLSSFD